MPYLDEGSAVYMIEDLIERPELMQSVVTSIMRGCRCAVIDQPFTASISSNGFVVDRVVGVGSVVCEAGCGGEGARVLASPAWGRGRVVEPSARCLFCGERFAAMQLRALGFQLEEVEFKVFVDRVTRGTERGVAVVDSVLDPLELEPLEGGCGTLRSANPLHPSGALGKPGLSGCVEKRFELVGPSSRVFMPVLLLNGAPLLGRFEGLGNGLVVLGPVQGSSRYVQLATWLGVLYECGSQSEHLRKP